MTFSCLSDETGFVKTANEKVHKTNAVFERSSRRQFEVVVIFTNKRATLEALKTAAVLAAGLGVKIRLLCLRILGPNGSDQPVSPRPFFKHRFRAVAGESQAELWIDVRHCRDRETMIERVLTPEAIVIIGGRRSWLAWEGRLGHKLRNAGHHVIFA